MIPLLLAITASQLPGVPFAGLIEGSVRLVTFQGAHAALNEDTELLEQHRGLGAFFDAHPALALTERAYLEQMRLPTFRNLTGAFEEALREDPGANERFRSYYGALAQDGTLRSSVDSLHRIELREGRRDVALSTAMAYLKSHPDEAMAFLDNPLHLLPTPEELYPLRDLFRTDRDLRSRLQEAFTALDQEAGTHEYLLPWWDTAYDDSGEVGQAYRALDAYFGRYPRRFWIWHRRNAAWASRPHELTWVTHFYALVRRNTALRVPYYDFLAMLRERPALGEMVEEAWQEDLRNPAAWPPAGGPRELPPITATATQPNKIPEWPNAPVRPEIARPERPTREPGDIRVPERPSRPDSPTPPPPQP